MFDGNGNVMGMIKASSGSIHAAYEYDAFGNTLRATGSYAGSNLFRFSTKFTDTETCLVYYGLRYYSPTLGRFINKDPIEEQGGLNLYGFVGNDGVNRWDYLGMTVQYAPRSGWLLYGEQGNTQALTGGLSDNSKTWFSMGTVVDNGGVSVNGTRWEGQMATALANAGVAKGEAGRIARDAFDNGLEAAAAGAAERAAIAGAMDLTKLQQAQAKLNQGGSVIVEDRNGRVIHFEAGDAVLLVGNNQVGRASLTVTDQGTMMLEQYPEAPRFHYIGNNVMINGTVAGVSASDLVVSQEWSRTTLDENGNSVSVPVSQDGAPWHLSEVGQRGSYNADGSFNLPYTTSTPEGHVAFTFYDGPGSSYSTGQVVSVSATFTTTVSQVSTGNNLVRRTWSTTTSVDSRGNGRTSFRQGTGEP